MRWIWIDKFVEFEPGKRAVAIKNISRAEPHLHDQYAAFPMMPAALVIEGMAQTAGILVGQARDFQERVILAKIKKALFDGFGVPGDCLSYEATIEEINPAAAMTSGRVWRNEQPFGEVDLVFSHLDVESGRALGIPEHNFVFHQDFKQLLSTYDVNIGDYPDTNT